LILSVAAAVATMVPFRGLFDGRYIGDTIDARWTSTVYEHWYLVLTGTHALRQTGIYFPYPNTLGFSDAFMLPGLIHSLFRFAGLQMITAWAATNIVLQIIFVIGLVVLSGQLFSRTLTRVIFIVVAGSGYTWVAQLEHPQTLVYGLLVWIVVAVVAGLSGSTQSANLPWLAVPVLVGVLALSAWYPFFFLLLLTPIAAIGILIFIPGDVVRERLHHGVMRIPKGLGVASLAIAFSLIVLWLWIYLPVADEVNRTWDDYLMHAPTLVDFFNANHLGGGLWSPLFDRVGWLFRGAPPNPEARVGFTPLLLAGLAATMVWALATISRRASRLASIELTVGWTIVVTWAFIAVDARGTSPFMLAWVAPGGNAIRAPMRVNIILSIAALAAVLLLLDRWISRQDSRSKRSQLSAYLALGVFGLALTAEQFRSDTARWSYARDDAALLADAGSALTRAQCTLFQVTQANPPSPDDTPVLESLIAATSRIPTNGGYSGGAPRMIPQPTTPVCELSWPSMDVTRG